MLRRTSDVPLEEQEAPPPRTITTKDKDGNDVESVIPGHKLTEAEILELVNAPPGSGY